MKHRILLPLAAAILAIFVSVNAHAIEQQVFTSDALSTLDIRTIQVEFSTHALSYIKMPFITEILKNGQPAIVDKNADALVKIDAGSSLVTLKAISPSGNILSIINLGAGKSFFMVGRYSGMEIGRKLAKLFLKQLGETDSSSQIRKTKHRQ